MGTMKHNQLITKQDNNTYITHNKKEGDETHNSLHQAILSLRRK